MTCEIEMELPEDNEKECVIWKALAVKLGMDTSKIALSLKQSQQLID